MTTGLCVVTRAGAGARCWLTSRRPEGASAVHVGRDGRGAAFARCPQIHEVPVVTGWMRRWLSDQNRPRNATRARLPVGYTCRPWLSPHV